MGGGRRAPPKLDLESEFCWRLFKRYIPLFYNQKKVKYRYDTGKFIALAFTRLCEDCTWIKTSTESLTSEPRVTEVTAFENMPSKVILSRL